MLGRIWICLVKLNSLAVKIQSLLNIPGYIQKHLVGDVHAHVVIDEHVLVMSASFYHLSRLCKKNCTRVSARPSEFETTAHIVKKINRGLQCSFVLSGFIFNKN